MNKINFEDTAILVVDDNPTNLKVLCEAIANSGWDILVATDGETAIEQAEYAQPHLILLDIMMPEIDGFETCRLLKENPVTREIPIIFMTALSDTIDKVKGLSIGAVDYITKPFETQEVLARMNVHLKLYLLTKELADQKMELEKGVVDRTAELKTALDELQQSQLQIVQNEKMSTLGQLVAGVAHEINNPVGFLVGNVSLLCEYTSDMINHLQLYRKNYPNPMPEIAEDAKAIYLDDLLQDIPEVINSMNVGIERISDISTSLRTFSRSDTSTKVAFDIHQGIESTLMILKHRLKANNNRHEIEIIKNYGNLPLIECYPGQLNQVFMNIISNAIEALDEYRDGQAKTDICKKLILKISTKVNTQNKSVNISILDNGSGMSPKVKQRVFTEFFTTKSVGKGTGLGLSISRRIVEDKHHGKLSCISALGEGTEFVIEIPIQ